METICRSLKLAFFYSVEKVENNTATFKAGKSWIDVELKEAGKFTEKDKSNEGGLLVDQTLEVSLLVLPPEMQLNDIGVIPVIAQLRNDNKEAKIWGDPSNPVIVSADKQGNAIQLQLNRKSLTYLDL